MGRFLVCDYEEARRFEDPDAWLCKNLDDWEQPNYLVDTEEGIIIFADRIEDFEDSQLTRGLQPLVRYMETLVS